MTKWCVFCAMQGSGATAATCTVDDEPACQYHGEQQAAAIGCAVVPLAGAAAIAPPRKPVRMEAKPPRPLDVKVTGGATLRMSPHAVLGAEVAIAETSRPGQAERLAAASEKAKPENAGEKPAARPAPRRIPEEVREAIRQADPAIPALYLARQHGVSDFSVMTIRKAAGIHVCKAQHRGRRRQNPAATDELIIAEAKAGKGVPAIAQQYGVAQETVRRVLRAAGVEYRRRVARAGESAANTTKLAAKRVAAWPQWKRDAVSYRATAEDHPAPAARVEYSRIPKEMAAIDNVAIARGSVTVHLHFDATAWTKEAAQCFLDYMVPQLKAISKALEG